MNDNETKILPMTQLWGNDTLDETQGEQPTRRVKVVIEGERATVYYEGGPVWWDAK